MKRIVVASKNPVKLAATKAGFERMFTDEAFDLVGINVDSKVGEQPIGDKVTLLGARNRVGEAKILYPKSDYWVGIEGGVCERDDKLEAMAWIVIHSSTQYGESRTGTFTLPKEATDLIRQGKELAQATDQIFNLTNSKHFRGAIGALTGNAIDRTAFYEAAIIMALIPFVNEALYA